MFFGNDVGFWQPHQQLSDYLSRQGFAVVGYDLRKIMKSTLSTVPPDRELVVRNTFVELIQQSISEFHAERLPLVLMGHSFGAEIAIWAAGHIDQPTLVGVVAMSPAAHGHLAITPMDFMSSAPPTDQTAFAVADLVGLMPSTMPVALVRGVNDRYAVEDSSIIVAGGSRLRKFSIPVAGHALKKIIFAKYTVRDAVDWVLSRNYRGGTASN